MLDTLDRTRRSVVILGAGPAGLAVGHELGANDDDVQITVLDRNNFVGGLCRTLENRGYKFDLGGHRWFTKNEDLNNWFRRLMKTEIVMVNRISRIYYGGSFYSYPVSFGDIIRNAGPITMIHAGFSFLWSYMRQAATSRPITNMRDAYVAQFGYKLYDMFFRRYSEKVWGLPCEKLSADWVAQRSKGMSIWSLVRNAILPSKNVVSLIDEFMYPRDGYMRIPERMAEDIVAKRNSVCLDSNVKRIAYHGPRDFEVFFEKDGAQTSLRCDTVVSTIPLGVLARILEPHCDETVKTAAMSLKFRSLVTVNVQLKKKQVTIDTWLYIQDEEILFGRMHEPKNWSVAMVPDDEHTSLVLECFCTQGDHIWEMSDDAISARCIRDLVDKLHFIEDHEVENTQVIRTTQAYPVYDQNYQKNINTVKAYLNQHQGLYMVGRGGTFRYNNADHSIEMGLLLGRKLLGADIDYMAVNTEKEYQEEIRSSKPQRDYYEAKPPRLAES